jgi:hypothetical protein
LKKIFAFGGWTNIEVSFLDVADVTPTLFAGGQRLSLKKRLLVAGAGVVIDAGGTGNDAAFIKGIASGTFEIVEAFGKWSPRLANSKGEIADGG